MDMKGMVTKLLMQRSMRTKGECDKHYDCEWSFRVQTIYSKACEAHLSHVFISLTRARGGYGKVMAGWKSQVM